MSSDDSKVLFAILLACPVGVLLGACVLRWRGRILDRANGDRLFFAVVVLYELMALGGYAATDVVPNQFVDGYYDRAVNLLHTGMYGGVGPDAAVYIPAGRAFYPPGYSLLLSVSILMFGEGIHAVFLLNISLFLITMYLFRLTLRRVGVQYYNAYTLVLLLSVGRFLFHFIPVSDAVGAYFATASILVIALAVRSQPMGLLLSFVAGLLTGWDILVRANAVLFVVPLLAIVLVASSSQRSRIVLSTAVVLGTLLPVGAWTVRNYNVFHEFFIVTTNGGYNLFHGNNDDADVLWVDQDAQLQADTAGMTEVDRDRFLSHQATVWIEQHPSEFAKLAAQKLVRAFGSDTAAISILQTEMDAGRANRLPDAIILAADFLANIVYFALVVLFLERCWRLVRGVREHGFEIGVTLLLWASTAVPVALTFGFVRYRDFFFYLMLMSTAGLLGRLASARRTGVVANVGVTKCLSPQSAVPTPAPAARWHIHSQS